MSRQDITVLLLVQAFTSVCSLELNVHHFPARRRQEGRKGLRRDLDLDLSHSHVISALSFSSFWWVDRINLLCLQQRGSGRSCVATFLRVCCCMPRLLRTFSFGFLLLPHTHLSSLPSFPLLLVCLVTLRVFVCFLFIWVFWAWHTHTHSPSPLPPPHLSQRTLDDVENQGARRTLLLEKCGILGIPPVSSSPV